MKVPFNQETLFPFWRILKQRYIISFKKHTHTHFPNQDVDDLDLLLRSTSILEKTETKYIVHIYIIYIGEYLHRRY